MKLDKAAIMGMGKEELAEVIGDHFGIGLAPLGMLAMEDQLEAKAIARKYTDHLIQLTTGNRNCDLPSWEECWKFLRATPEQRCRAALLAVML